MHPELQLLVLFLIASAVAVVARKLRVPYTVALVLAGLALGMTRVIHLPHLTKELLYTLFLPGLVFEAAFHLDARRFAQNRVTILSLAVPGLLLGIAVTAALVALPVGALHWMPGFLPRHAVLLAAILGATDPIAVVSLFRTLGAPRRLTVLIEGESLLNDGTAVVVFTIVLDALSGGRFSIGHAVLEFIRVVGIGALVGALIGLGVSRATRWTDDTMVEITLTTLAAYGSFALTERLHASGIIATVIAGMLFGRYNARDGMSPSTRLAVESFWEYVAFALNSVVFLLMGFEVRLLDLARAWPLILLAYFAMTLGRSLVVFVVRLALSRSREKMPGSWVAVMTWGGLRGGLSMVLALALPAEMPHRATLIAMTFGAVILSILTQGLSMAPLLRRLGLVRASHERVNYEFEKARMQGATAALNALERFAREGVMRPDLIARLKAEYAEKAESASQQLREVVMSREALDAEEHCTASRQLLLIEKDAILSSIHSGGIGAEAGELALRALDARLVALEDSSHAED